MGFKANEGLMFNKKDAEDFASSRNNDRKEANEAIDFANAKHLTSFTLFCFYQFATILQLFDNYSAKCTSISSTRRRINNRERGLYKLHKDYKLPGNPSRKLSQQVAELLIQNRRLGNLNYKLETLVK